MFVVLRILIRVPLYTYDQTLQRGKIVLVSRFFISYAVGTYKNSRINVFLKRVPK